MDIVIRRIADEHDRLGIGNALDQRREAAEVRLAIRQGTAGRSEVEERERQRRSAHEQRGRPAHGGTQPLGNARRRCSDAERGEECEHRLHLEIVQ
jgi:hypothetical protein